MTRVLVVDDEPDVREMIFEVLDAEGYDVVTVPDGETALERVYASRVDMVTLDLRMPGRDSKEVLAEMRRVSPATPVIVISGYASREVAQACLELGAFAVIQKPFEVAHLLGVLERARHASGRPLHH